VASYPIFASAHHALDPPYPEQHPRPSGLQAYSGVCGQEFVDFPNWPKELQGGMVKVRYKSTNRVEFLEWNEGEFGYDEAYKSDIIFSSNLSFIPVDLRYGPRGAMYVCDWYNPVKGHAQYSLRDERRDRLSGRIWRIFPKGAKPQDPPKIAGASISELLDILKRREYRYRYWAKRELREKKPAEVKAALDKWVAKLDPKDERFRHHQVEAIWAYRNVEEANLPLLREVLACDNHHARAAAARQLRHWHGLAKDGDKLLARAGSDENGLVRLEAAIACSYVGTKEAFEVLAEVATLPSERHLAYAIKTSLGSAPIRKFWDKDTLEKTNPKVYAYLFKQKVANQRAEKNQRDKKFDRQNNLLKVKVSCIKERMLFAAEYMLKPNLGEYKEAFGEIPAKPNQPIRIEFDNPDATPHNFVLVQPNSLEEVGLAANEMAKDPEAAKSGQFIPKSKKIIVYTNMLKQGEKETLRFKSPRKPGRYPYLCSFPGHWAIMKGTLVVK
jgi:plastocyanin